MLKLKDVTLYSKGMNRKMRVVLDALMNGMIVQSGSQRIAFAEREDGKGFVPVFVARNITEQVDVVLGYEEMTLNELNLRANELTDEQIAAIASKLQIILIDRHLDAKT